MVKRECILEFRPLETTSVWKHVYCNKVNIICQQKQVNWQSRDSTLLTFRWPNDQHIEHKQMIPGKHSTVSLYQNKDFTPKILSMSVKGSSRSCILSRTKVFKYMFMDICTFANRFWTNTTGSSTIKRQSIEHNNLQTHSTKDQSIQNNFPQVVVLLMIKKKKKSYPNSFNLIKLYKSNEGKKENKKTSLLFLFP